MGYRVKHLSPNFTKSFYFTNNLQGITKSLRFALPSDISSPAKVEFLDPSLNCHCSLPLFKLVKVIVVAK